ncbi:transposase-like protein [Paraburkholderia sp. HC6.4b]|uniref:DUF746 domain-containing protein n=1 Tax=unclassified Paraburkholderia TaxID=2615204 RepID=UPI001859FC91|nr:MULTISPECIES: DUF746 domain-containing protein [unclassified Paraburkholderia]MBB5409203.1 transposase-like protein [Paraburkholderia sp. HC6.4b]MBB5450931.1 transposase-like protein [Paraburkholderia sp. Kb1A]
MTPGNLVIQGLQLPVAVESVKPGMLSNRPDCVVPADSSRENRDLTAYLTAKIDAVLSASHEPRPGCPRCGGNHINSAGFRTRPFGRLPMFECKTCNRYFGRTAGTPLEEKHLKKLDVFVSLLSQPISCVEAGERMGSLPGDIKERVTAYRAWLLQLDPDGKWERLVRLGGRPAELSPAPLLFDESGAREDLGLTARLTREFDELNSMSHRPPSCPDCGSRMTHCVDHPKGGFPHFRCTGCKLKFSRRRGTPFVNTKMGSRDRMRTFIRYLSLPLPFMQVSDEIGTSHGMIQKWRDMFTAFADQLEPSGTLSARIRVGSTPGTTTPCPFCGRSGTAQYTDARGWSCAGCGRLFSMRRKVVERNGQFHIADDAA